MDPNRTITQHRLDECPICAWLSQVCPECKLPHSSYEFARACRPNLDSSATRQFMFEQYVSKCNSYNR